MPRALAKTVHPLSEGLAALSDTVLNHASAKQATIPHQRHDRRFSMPVNSKA